MHHKSHSKHGHAHGIKHGKHASHGGYHEKDAHTPVGEVTNKEGVHTLYKPCHTQETFHGAETLRKIL